MSLNVVKGKIRPLKDHVLVTDMEFEEERTASGLFIPSQDGKETGIKPRWGRVWAIGPDQIDVKIGEWILLPHGRWTRGITIVDDNGDEIIIRRVDTKDIMISADEKPSDFYTRKL